MEIITKEEQERQKLTRKEAIKLQIKEFIKKPVLLLLPTYAVYCFFYKNLNKSKIDTLVTKIDNIIKDFSINEIISYYPASPNTLFDTLLLDRTFSLFPTKEYGQKRENWEKEKTKYIEIVLNTEKFNETKLKQTRNRLAELLGIEHELGKESTIFEELNKLEKKPYSYNEGSETFITDEDEEEETEEENGDEESDLRIDYDKIIRLKVNTPKRLTTTQGNIKGYRIAQDLTIYIENLDMYEVVEVMAGYYGDSKIYDKLNGGLKTISNIDVLERDDYIRIACVDRNGEPISFNKAYSVGNFIEIYLKTKDRKLEVTEKDKPYSLI